MPFTPSHAVVALPFLRTPLVPAAIAVGAMAPDLPLFVRGLPLHYGLTHSLAWLPLTIVLALALLLVWRCVLRPAARELSPAVARPTSARGVGCGRRATRCARRSRSPACRRGPSWRGILLLIASLAIGIVTHIVWDLFTHEGRWGVQIVPLLDEQWGPLAGVQVAPARLVGARPGDPRDLGCAVAASTAARVRAARLLPDPVRWAWWLSLPVAPRWSHG